VATERHPEHDPIAEEAERVLRDNPGLRARLREYQRKRRADEPVETVEHEEVRRQLREPGVPLDED
jgi:ribosomal protein L31E